MAIINLEVNFSNFADFTKKSSAGLNPNRGTLTF